MLPNRSPVSLSSGSAAATLLLFLFVSLPLPLPLLATPAPDQYDAPTAQHHHQHQPKEVRSIKLQSAETGSSSSLQHHQPAAAVQESHNGPLHSIKLQHSEYSLHDDILLGIPTSQQQQQRNDKLSSSDHNKRSVDDDGSKIHRVKLTKSDYHQTGSLLPFHAAEAPQLKEKNPDTIHYEGDDDITIDKVKSLDVTLTEELDTNVDDNNVPTLYSDIRRAKRETQEESVRQKRDFIRWYGASSFQSYRPQPTYISSYQFSGHAPYFIPVWGNPSRIPIFFPIKPILFNPGYPVANPPPQPQPTQQPNFPPGGGDSTEPPIIDGNVNIGNRINIDDTRVWGIVETPSNSNTNNNNNNGGIPQRPQSTGNRKPPTPSLLHRPSRTDADDEIDVNARPITQIPNELRPTQNNPPPQTSSNNNNRDPLFDVANQSPPFTQTIRTTRRPQTVNNLPGQAREPSRCVWAVISCCSPLSSNVRYSCFEQLGCNGSFWDGNPCSREVTTAALNAAQKFYEQTGTRRR